MYPDMPPPPPSPIQTNDDGRLRLWVIQFQNEFIFLKRPSLPLKLIQESHWIYNVLEQRVMKAKHTGQITYDIKQLCREARWVTNEEIDNKVRLLYPSDGTA